MVVAVDSALLAPEHDGKFPPLLVEPLLERALTSFAKRRQILISEGGSSADVFFIIKGKIQISLFSLHGRETILREMGPGEIFGELSAIDDAPRSANAVVLEDLEFARLSNLEFRGFLADEPDAAIWMMRQLSALVRNLTHKTFELANMSVNNRLQSELLRLAISAGVQDDRSVILGLPTHANLAARIGTHREAVTRELNQLANEGIIELSRGKAVVSSVIKLQALHAKTLR